MNFCCLRLWGDYKRGHRDPKHDCETANGFFRERERPNQTYTDIMDIQVKCTSCKATYSFDEEPLHGRIRTPVQCTNCGTDGTFAANEFIRKSLNGELELERQRNNVWWRKAFRPRDDDESMPAAKEDNAHPEPGKMRTGLGVMGACLGGFGGMMLWFAVVAYSGWEIGYVAWLVGILAGLGTRLFVPNGNFAMASTAALCAFLAIMGGQILAMKTIYGDIMGELYAGSYDRAIGYAKAAAKVKSDAEISALLRKYPTALMTFRDEENLPGASRETKLRQLGSAFMVFGGDEEVDSVLDELIEAEGLDPLSEEEILRYKTEEVPLLTEFANGKPSRSEFEAIIKAGDFEEASLKEMVIQSWSPYQLLWLFLGVGSAYKLAYNRSETEDV